VNISTYFTQIPRTFFFCFLVRGGHL
jgi:hypothetical protein